MRIAASTAAGRRAIADRLPALPEPPGWLRRWLLVLAALLLVSLAGYRFWLRDSSLVSVERVSVTGVTTEDAKRLRAALVSTAQTMTTLNLDGARLEEVTAGYPVVRRLEIETDLPHDVRIRVVEHDPAAIAESDRGRVPVAADGTVLRGLPVEQSLPTVHTDGGLRGDRLADAAGRRAARVAGTAAPALRHRLIDVSTESERGYVARLRDGPELVFGGARGLEAKWAAAARVLADPEAAGAAYLDLRVPGRPALGGFSSVAAPAPEPGF